MTQTFSPLNMNSADGTFFLYKCKHFKKYDEPVYSLLQMFFLLEIEIYQKYVSMSSGIVFCKNSFDDHLNFMVSQLTSYPGLGFK